MKFKSKYKKSKTVNGFVTGLVVGGIIFTGIGGVAVTLAANQIKYTPSNDKFNVTNAKEALDEIYKIAEYEIPADTYFYDSDTEGENIVRYKKVDGKFYLCDENGKVEDNASEVNVSDKNLIEYTSSNSKNLSVGSAGYSNNFLHLGDGFDNASYEDSGYRKGYTQGLADGLTTKSGTAKDLGYFGLQTIPTGLTSIKAIAVRIDGRYASGQMRNWVATYSAIGDVYASGGNICINYTTSGLNPGVGDGTVYWYAIGE